MISTCAIYDKTNRASVLQCVEQGVFIIDDKECELSSVFVDETASHADIGRLIDTLTVHSGAVETLDLSCKPLTRLNARRVEMLLRMNRRLKHLSLNVPPADTASFIDIATGYTMNKTVQHLRFVGDPPVKYENVRSAFMSACDMVGHPRFSDVRLSGRVDAPNLFCDLVADRLSKQMVMAVKAPTPIVVCFRDVELTQTVTSILQTFIETIQGLTCVVIADCVVDASIFSGIASALISSSWLTRVTIAGGAIHPAIDPEHVDSLFVRALRVNPDISPDSVWIFPGSDENQYPRIKALVGK